MDTQTIISMITLGLNLFIVPLIWLLWKLNENIHDLRLTLHRDFVTNARLDERLAQLEQWRERHEKA